MFKEGWYNLRCAGCFRKIDISLQSNNLIISVSNDLRFLHYVLEQLKILCLIFKHIFFSNEWNFFT